MKRIVMLVLAAAAAFVAPRAQAGTSNYEAKAVVVNFTRALCQGNLNRAARYVVAEDREEFELYSAEKLRRKLAKEAGFGVRELEIAVYFLEASDFTVIARTKRDIWISDDEDDDLEDAIHLRIENGAWRIILDE